MAKVVRILMKNGPKKMPGHKGSSGDLRFCAAICSILMMYEGLKGPDLGSSKVIIIYTLVV